MKKILFYTIVSSFYFFTSCSANHICMSSWKKIALDTSKECPDIIFSKNHKVVCVLVLNRCSRKYPVRFQALFELSDTIEDIVGFPRSRIDCIHWDDSTSSNVIRVDTCDTYECGLESSSSLEEIEVFSDNVLENLRRGLPPTRAFLWAMKKNHYY
jgi:hypothetical protein